MFPFAFGQGKRYFEWQAVGLLLALLAALVWLAAPIAISMAFGPTWTLGWLVPTGAAVCSIGFMRGHLGGGG